MMVLYFFFISFDKDVEYHDVNHPSTYQFWKQETRIEQELEKKNVCE